MDIVDAMDEVVARPGARASEGAEGAVTDFDPFWDMGYADKYGPWMQSTEEYGFDVCPRCGRRPMLALETPPFAASCPRGCPRQLFVRSDTASLGIHGVDFAKHEMKWFWHQRVLVEENRMREEDGLP